jgi:hypothetical protein
MKMRKTKIISFAVLSSLFYLSPVISAADVSEETKIYPSIVAVSQATKAPFCTGTAVSYKHVLTAASCLFGADGAVRERLNVLPGINLASQNEPGGGKRNSRAFGVRAFIGNASRVARTDGADGMGLIPFLSQDLAVLEIGRIEGEEGLAVPFEDVFQFSDTIISSDQMVTVRGYIGDNENAGELHQASCQITAQTVSSIILDCELPQGMLGALVVQEERPAGIVTAVSTKGAVGDEISPSGGALVARLAHSGLQHLSGASDAPEALAMINTVEWEAIPFSAIEGVNRCDQDVHLGLLWFDAFEQTTKTLARRLPAKSHTLLPAATTADTVFTYARSDDGTYIWDGDDGKAIIKGMTLSMQARKIGDQPKDVPLLFECEK